jgi:RND family efflux transporter MFP subunit
MKTVIIVIVILILGGLTAWKLLGNKEKAEAKVYRADPNAKVLVTAALVQAQTLGGQADYLGTFEPEREIKLLAETSGKVVRVGVQDGQAVGAGHVIAQVDDEMLRLQIEALQVNLEGQQKDVARYTNLAKGEAVPAVQQEKAELAVRATQAQLKQLQKQLRNTTIIAPFAGVVTQRMFDLGAVLSPGAPVAQLTDVGSLKLTLNVPETDVNQFAPGQRVEVQTDVYPDRAFAGTVSMVGVKGDASHNYPVQVRVANGGAATLRAGMYGRVNAATQAREAALAIPRQALIGSAKNPQVFVLTQGKASLRPITTGASNNDYVEVLKGLQAGEQVITSGHINLEDGSAVMVKQ